MSVKGFVQLSLIFIYIFALFAYIFPFTTSGIQHSVLLFTSLVSVAGGVYAVMTYGLHGARSRTVVLLTIGMVLLFIGEALWNYYEVLGVLPFPSNADFFYLLSYPFLLWGLLNEILLAKIVWKNFSKALIFMLFFTAFLLACIVGYFGVFLAYHSTEPLFNNIIAMAYGVADLVLILVNLLVLLLVLEFRGGKLSKTWISIFIGFVAMLIADILFAIFTMDYESGVGMYKTIIDGFFMLSYLLFAYGLFDLAFSLEEITYKLSHKKK